MKLQQISYARLNPRAQLCNSIFFFNHDHLRNVLYNTPIQTSMQQQLLVTSMNYWKCSI